MSKTEGVGVGGVWLTRGWRRSVVSSGRRGVVVAFFMKFAIFDDNVDFVSDFIAVVVAVGGVEVAVVVAFVVAVLAVDVDVDVAAVGIVGFAVAGASRLMPLPCT